MTAIASPQTEVPDTDGDLREDTGLHARTAVRLPFRGTQLWLLVAITLLAGVLRLLDLGEWSIWVDEAHTWRDVTMPLDGFFDSAPGWYPTSYLMLRWLMDWGWLPQFTEGWLRLPFAFCGILTVPLLALFGNLLVGRRAALLSALFLAINPWHIYWSQNARGYVLVAMFSVIAAGAYWLGITRRSRWWLTFGVLSALVAGSCHTTGLVLLPVFMAYPLLASRNLAGRRLWISLFAVGIALTLVPSLLELVPPLRIFKGARPDTEPSLVHLAQTVAFYFRLPMLCAATIGMWMLFQLRMQGRVLFLACWALLPLLLLGFVGSVVVKVTARYALCALPAVLLLAGAASVRVSEVLAAGLGRSSWLSRLLPTAMLPVILCLDMGAYDYLYYRVQYGDRGRWQEASRVLQRIAGETPIAVCTTHEPVLMYYLRPNNYRDAENMRPDFGTRVYSLEKSDVYQVGENGEPGNGFNYMREAIRKAREEGRQLFVAAAMPELREKDPDGTVRQALRRDFELIEVLPCWVGPKDETVYVWQVRR